MPACRAHVIVLAVLTLSAAAACGSENTERLDELKAAHQLVLSAAKDDLLAEFDKKIALLKKKAGPKPEAQLNQIAALEKERENMQLNNTIPFSPVMRLDALEYLKTISKSVTPLVSEYDNHIKRAINAKDTERAQSLAEEKDELAFVVGIWHCQGVNFNHKFTWKLYSDGSVNRTANANWALPKGWTFLPNGGMLIKNYTAGGPKGGFDDKCTMHWDGQTFQAKNQKGGIYTGSLQ